MVEALKEKEMSFEEYNELEGSYISDLQILWKGQATKLGIEQGKLIDHYDN